MSVLSAPKNYSRKISKDGFICSCLCPIRLGIASTIFDYSMIKYEIEPKLDVTYYPNKRSKYRPSTTTFKKIIELPKYFHELEINKDYKYNIAYFIRDNVQVPFVHDIEIINVEKYKSVKNKEARKKKLNQLNNLDI